MTLRHLYGKFSLSQNCMVIWPTSPCCDIRFYYHHLQPLFAFERAQIAEHMQASFRMSDLYQYVVAMPPVREQKAIATFLDELGARHEALIEEVLRAINLLRERRAALISAAVTGKIDVRDTVAQPPSRAA